MPFVLEIVDLLQMDAPHFEKVVIPGVAHMVSLEKPKEFGGAALGFLAKVYLTKPQRCGLRSSEPAGDRESPRAER